MGIFVMPMPVMMQRKLSHFWKRIKYKTGFDNSGGKLDSFAKVRGKWKYEEI